MPQYTLLMARFPGSFREHPTSSDWFFETWHKALGDPLLGPGHVLRTRKSDTPIYMTRNQVVVEAQHAKADYVLMIDEDMDPDYELKTNRHAKPFWEVAWDWVTSHRDEPCAIAAPYMGGARHHENPFEFQWCRWANDGVRASLEQYSREQVALFGGVGEVAALPTGLILYDTRVFHDSLKPWFDYEHDAYKTQKCSTEDVYQTRNQSLAWYMSQGKVGGKCYCTWDSWAGHWKERRIEKPEIVPVEAVGQQLRDAVLGNHHADERQVWLPRPKVHEKIAGALRAAVKENGFAKTDTLKEMTHG